MKSLCVIPARYASTRLPGKPLREIKGQTLIERVCRRVVELDLFDAVVVATDDERIFDHCSLLGLQVMMTADDHISGTDRVAEVARHHADYDIVVNVQGDEPFIEKDLLERMIEKLQDGTAEIVTGVAKMEGSPDNPNVVKVVLNTLGQALYFSRSVIPFDRGQVGDVPYLRHVGTYGFRRNALMEVVALPASSLELTESLEQLRWLENGKQILCIQGPWLGRGVDTEEDLEWANSQL